MRGDPAAVRRPSWPFQSISLSAGSSVMPSHQTSPSGVSATLVKIEFSRHGQHGIGIGVHGGARRDAEKAVFRVNGIKAAVGAEFHPGDIVADAIHFPAGNRGNEHGQVGLAAGAGKSGGDIFLPALRVLDAQDKHVLGQPAFVARHDRSNAQARSISCPAGRCRHNPSHRTRSSRSSGK